MTNSPMYCPFLKAREGEFIALGHLTADARGELIPFFDIQKPPKSKSLLLHLQSITDQMAKTWGEGHPLYVDLLDFGLDARIESGEHPASYVFRQLRVGSLFPVHAIPVTGLLTERDKEYLSAIKEIVSVDARGMGLRLQREDLDDPAHTSDNVFETLALITVPPSNVDLFIDFRAILDDDIAKLAHRAVRLLRMLAARFRFRSLTVASSNVPDSVADVVEEWDSVAKVQRTEWRLWDLIRAELPVPLRFADYATVAPDFIGSAGGNPNINAKIRYTTSHNYIFLRGRPLFKPEKNFHQFHDLAAKLTQMEEFAGAKASWGDRQIAACARRTISHGSLTTWVQLTCNHHLEHTVLEVRQRATTPASA